MMYLTRVTLLKVLLWYGLFHLVLSFGFLSPPIIYPFFIIHLLKKKKKKATASCNSEFPVSLQAMELMIQPEVPHSHA